MAGTMVYMLALLALASTMLMFGFFSSTHTSMYTLQSSFDEHDRLLRRVRQADSEMAGQFNDLRRSVEDMRNKLQAQQATIDKQGEALFKESAAHVEALSQAGDQALSKAGAAQGELSKQVHDIQQEMTQLREQLHTAGTLQDNLRTESPSPREDPSPSVGTRMSESERKVGELASEQKTLLQRMNSHDEAQHRLQEQIEHLNRTVETQLPALLTARTASAAETTKPHPSGPASVEGRALVREEERPPSHASNHGTGGFDQPTLPIGKQVVSPRTKAAYLVSWYRECGCTGMEIEAVTLLVSLANKTGVSRVRTNKCSETETCIWPASTRALLDQIEVEESQLAEPSKNTGSEQGDSSPATIVLVVHQAFRGVCMMPTSLILPLRSQEDPISEPQRGLFRVSRSMLETDRLDVDTAKTCNEQFDAVWVPSKFNVGTFSKSGVNTSLLHVLPEAVDTTLYNCSGGAPPRHRPHRSFGLPQLDSFLARGADKNTFTFLSIFKWEERKNWRDLLTSFYAAFPENVTDITMEDGRKVGMTVRLLIKTQELSWGTDPYQDSDALISTLGAAASGTLSYRLLIVKESLSSVMMPSLYLMADAFVLPTHGEGWGLPLMEAMASGLPTVATNWGGQTEFMNASNAFVVDYELVDSDPIMNPGHRWAAPKAKDLQQAMRDIIARPNLARSRAQRGCRDVQTLYTAEKVAQRTVDLIAELHTEISR